VNGQSPISASQHRAVLLATARLSRVTKKQPSCYISIENDVNDLCPVFFVGLFSCTKTTKRKTFLNFKNVFISSKTKFSSPVDARDYYVPCYRQKIRYKHRFIECRLVH